jgi:hypothetical protein
MIVGTIPSRLNRSSAQNSTQSNLRRLASSNSAANGMSQFLSKQFLLGLVGYVYDQVSGDSGSGDKVGAFESRVVGIGPQVGYLFPVGDMQGYLNLKAYGEFDARDRPSGVNVWLTFAITPTAPPAAASTMPMPTPKYRK